MKLEYQLAKSSIPSALQKVHPNLNQEQALEIATWMDEEISSHLMEGYQIAFIKPEAKEPGSKTSSFELTVLNLDIGDV